MLESERFLGTYTRYGTVVMLPFADTAGQDWIEALEFVGSRLDRPGILLPTSDLHSVLVSQHRGSLQRHFRFVVADPETLGLIVDKRSQYGIAEAAGIPIPRSHFPESVDEVRLASERMSYPCLLKPYRSHAARKRLGRKVVVVHSAADLVSGYAQLGRDVPLMVQEIIPGDDSALFGYLALWDQGGRELAWVTKRKLRQYPPRYGDGSFQITVEAPEITELSRRLLTSFDYRGFVGVEFKLDPRDHTHRLMEINPRTVSGNQLAISAGIDFPWIGYQYLAGSDLDAASQRPFRPNVKYVNEEWDVQAYLALRRAGALSLRGWLGSLRGVEARAFAAWDDPMPLVVGVMRLVRKLCSP